MSEAIVKLTSDHIKVKGGEYVRDYEHGAWEFISEDYYRCSECGDYGKAYMNFCPNCGAQMDKGKGVDNGQTD